MAEQSSRTRYTGQQVLALLDEEDNGMEDTFFPGSDEELGMGDSDSTSSDEAEERYKNTDKCKHLATTGYMCV